jgi:hypothetical protein
MIFVTVGVLISRGSISLSPPAEPKMRTLQKMKAIHLFGISVGSIALYLVALILLVGPASVLAMGGGRSADVVTAGVPAIVMMIPLMGSLAASIYIISLGPRSPIRWKELLTIVLVVSLSVVMLSSLGNRRFLIPAVLMPVIAVAAMRKTPARAIYMILGVLGFLLTAILPMVRSSGSRLAGETLLDSIVRYASEQGLDGIVLPVFASNDTEMLDYIGVFLRQVESGHQSFGFGQGTFGDFLTSSIPSALFKGTSYSDQILTNIWGGGCGKPFCPVASVVGVSYFDAGIFGVILGCGVFGYFMGWLTNRLTRLQNLGPFAATTTVIFSSFAIVLTRTNTINALWWSIYTIVLATPILWLTTRRRSDRANDALQMTNPVSAPRTHIKIGG